MAVSKALQGSQKCVEGTIKSVQQLEWVGCEKNYSGKEASVILKGKFVGYQQS